MDEAFEHAMVLHVATVSTLVLLGHHLPRPGKKGINVLKRLKFD